MSDQQLTTGEPVPEDGSHRELQPDGQQKAYVVLSPEERAKGFVKPYRNTYVHEICGTATNMGRALSETYARDPYFYSGTFCVGCNKHFDLNQFHWDDGEPMDPLLQEDWHKGRAEREAAAKEERRQQRLRALREQVRAAQAEIARLEKNQS